MREPNPHADAMPEHLRRDAQGPYDETVAWVDEPKLRPTPERDVAEARRRAGVALRYELGKASTCQQPALVAALRSRA